MGKKLFLLILLSLLFVLPCMSVSAATDTGIVDIEETTEITTEETSASTYGVTSGSTNNKGNSSSSSSVSNGASSNSTNTGSGDIYIDDNGNVQVTGSVTTEGFFKKLQNKLLEVFTGFKGVALVIIMIIFIVLIILLAVSLAGEKKRIPGYCVGILICLVCFVFVMYAPEIITSFSNWFVSD